MKLTLKMADDIKQAKTIKDKESDDLMTHKKKTVRKLLNLLLTLAMIIGVVSGMSMTVQAAELSGSGTEADPYLIQSTDDWNTLGTNVSSGTDYTGKYFRLTKDITVSNMIGQNNHGGGSNEQTNLKSFSGTFDGDGHTLTVNINKSDTHAAAPFTATKNATIKNLNVKGKVEGGIHSSGLVGVPNGTLTVENCIVSVDVSSGASYLGGLVGHGFNATINLKSSTFNGSLKSDASNATIGGMVGWCGLSSTDKANIMVSDCLFSGSYSPSSANFSPLGFGVSGSSNATLENFSSTENPTGSGNVIVVASGATNEVISYLEAAWDGNKKQVVYTEKTINAAQVTKLATNTTAWNTGWYIATSDITISNRVTVSGTVHLILKNGVTLKATKGISVDQNNTFYIHGQSNDTGKMGILYSRYDSTTGQAAAGIGGSGRGKKAGKITIDGGKIFTSGSREAGGAGIGGGFQATGTNTTINGGVITIPARKSVAGIGGGREASSGNITINGGTLNVGGYSGASIGGSYHGSANTITIRGGYIKATNYTKGAAIGSGEKNNSGTKAGTINISGGTVIATNSAGSGSGAAAIGGGYNVPGSIVNISGGTVIATSTYGAGIGGGPGANGGTVKITGGTVTAYSSGGGVGIGAGKGKTGHGTLTIASTHVSRAGDSESKAAACFNYPSHRKKYVKIWPHTHSEIVKGIDGNVLYATCTEDNCNMFGGKLTFTLDAPNKLYDKKVYDKAKTTWYSASHNEWDEYSKITGTTTKSGGNIEYYQNTDTGEVKLSGAPTDEGTYIAKYPVVINSEKKYLEKEFLIVKPEAYFTEVPKAIEQTYTGSEQELVTAGVGKDGTVQYSPDNENWSSSIPKATKAGTYPVWFMVKADDLHNDSPVFSVDVTIAKAPAPTITDSQKPTARTEFPKESEKEGGEELINNPVDSLPEGYKIYYAVGEDETTVPEEGWSPDIPKGMEGTYTIWFKVVKVDDTGNIDDNCEETIPEKLTVKWIPEYNVLYDDNEATGGTAPVDEKYYKPDTEVTVLDKGDLVKEGYVFEGWYIKSVDEFVDEEGSTDVAKASGEEDANNKVYQKDDTFVIASDVTLSAKWIPVAKIINAPGTKNMTYSGVSQELVTAGEAEGGTILYAVGKDSTTEPTEESAWNADIPEAANVGTYYIWYKVKGEGDYIDSDAACVKSTIAKAVLNENVVSLNMDGYVYNTEPSIPAVSSSSAVIMNRLKEAQVKYYYNITNNNTDGTEWKDITGNKLNAGTYYMYAVIPESENYEGYTTVPKAFTVEKATWVKTQAFGSAAAGVEGIVDLKDYIAADGTLGSISTDNAVSQNDSYPSVTEDKILKFKFKEDVQGNETIAKITIPVTNATNYKDYSITAEVSAPAKIPQILAFDNENVSKTYGDNNFTLVPTRKPADGDYGEPYGELKYSSSNADVAEIDYSTGEVTIKSAGTAVIKVDAARTAPVEAEETSKPGYLPATASYTLTVNKKAVTVKAKDRSIYVGGEIPVLNNPASDADYTVEGLVGDNTSVSVTLQYQKNGTVAVPDNSQQGTYDIVPLVEDTGMSNYTFNYESGILTIANKKKQTIEAEDVTVAYGETDKAITARLAKPESGGGSISYAVKSGSGSYINVDENGKLTIKEVPASGKAYVTVTAAETAEYTKATKDVCINVEKATQTPLSADGLKVTKTSGPDENDGVIDGLDSAVKYEYSIDDGDTWMEVEEGETKIENLHAGEVLIRKQGDKNTNPSNEISVTVENKKSQIAPDVTELTITKTSGVDKTDGKISGLNPEEEYEYSVDDGKNWISVEKGKTTIENLPAGEVLIRKPENDDAYRSEEVKVTVGTKEDQTAPEADKLSVTKTSGTDKADGKISGLDPKKKYEYSVDGGKTWTPLPEGATEIENLSAGEVLIRKPGDADRNPSEATKVTVGTKEDQTAPEADKLSVTKTSGTDKADGKISGLDPEEKYEYSTDEGKTWIPLPERETTIENLSVGEVLIRKPGDADRNPGEATKVTVDTKKEDAAPVQPKPAEQPIQASANKNNNIAINAGFKVIQKGSKITIKWGKVDEATGYEVYVTYCGKKFSKIPAKRTKTKTSTVVTKIGGKKINLKKNFKVYVVAVKKDGSKVIQLAKTITGHIVGRKNTNYTNVKSITLKTKTLSIAVGKTSKIKAKSVLVSKKKKQLSDAHASQFRYASTDESIATVDKNGNVKGVSAGTTTVYVYARNGCAKTVSVTVK